MRHTRLRPLWLLVVVCPFVFPAVGWGQAAPAATPDVSIDHVPIKQYVQRAPGWLTLGQFRTQFAAPAQIDVLDVLVGPEQLAEKIKLSSGGLLEIQAGDAIVHHNGKKIRLIQGAILPVAPGDTLAIDNRTQMRPWVARFIRIGDVMGEKP